MKILFVKLKNIGDALLLTPALQAARSLWPEAQIDVLLRGGTEGILRGSIALDNCHTTAAPEKKKRPLSQFFKDLQLLGRLRKERYDWVFELSDNDRGRIMSIGVGAKNRAVHAAYDFPFWAQPFFNHKSPLLYGEVHRCEKDLELLRSFCGFAGESPALQFDRSFVDWSFAQGLSQPPIVLHAATRWKRKQWPVEKWQALAKRLAAVAPLVLTSGPSAEEVEVARQIAGAVTPGRATVTEGKLSWPQMAGLLYSAKLVVAVDTATMHLAAACQTPLVAIWGPTNETQWAPWRCPHERVSPPMPASGNPQERAIASVEVEAVAKACERMMLAAKS